MTSSFQQISQYYDALVERYGYDPRACDYGRPESQAIKFAVLAAALDCTGLSVLDVGCGFADYAAYLSERYPGAAYTGVDLSPAMIERARQIRPALDLRAGNVLELEGEGRYDLVTANGIFYLLGESAWDQTRLLIRKMFALARRAVAFNTLSAWAPDPEPGEFYADPLEVLRFCHELTPWVTLRHDYHPRDFTVYLYKRRGEKV
jgi:SAM-dependent methyltransferase